MTQSTGDIVEAASHVVMRTKARITFESDEDIDTLSDDIAEAIKAERERIIAKARSISAEYLNGGFPHHAHGARAIVRALLEGEA